MVDAHTLPRRSRSGITLALAGAGFAAILATPVQAASPQVLLAAAPGIAGAADCDAVQPAAAARSGATLSRQSKTTAILGQASALDAIRAQQESREDHPLFAGSPAQPLEPAAGPAPARQAGCGVASPFAARAVFDPVQPLSFMPRPTAQPPMAPSPAVGGAEDRILGSKLVPVGSTSFDSAFARVSRARTNLGPTLAAIGAPRVDQKALVASVNRWVNRSIAHAEDRELFGRADYWADAGTTLRLGKGDCEDFALLKMELLAAAGISRDDMILTLARDLIRRRDHAVLLVKTDEGYLMLDNVGDAPLDARADHGYRPVMSLGAKQSWLHGY